ncbi:uncharacterized protein METZ01_LOCUS104892 [marine metagenome]|uniref:Uncharacterized protein n=1 Tax=marine metagenome TaxID=408172 RepID=A0A381WIS6_9ZZZZ
MFGFWDLKLPRPITVLDPEPGPLTLPPFEVG